MTENKIPRRDIWRARRTVAVRATIGGLLSGFIFLAAMLCARDLQRAWNQPAQAQPAAIPARVAPLKTAVRQLKSGVWRVTIETRDARAGRLRQMQALEVTAR